jgi:hypothetical protein
MVSIRKMRFGSGVTTVGALAGAGFADFVREGKKIF